MVSQDYTFEGAPQKLAYFLRLCLLNNIPGRVGSDSDTKAISSVADITDIWLGIQRNIRVLKSLID